MGLVKASIKVEHNPRVEFVVLFNPEEYTLNQDNNFASQTIPGLSSPLLQFVNGNLRTLDMELFFDTYDNATLPKPDVRDITNRFIKLMEIDPELHAPPVLRFSWASLQFRCVLAKATQKFILFWDDGRPVRARLTVTFNEYVDLEREAKRVSRRSADFSKVHIVTQGETLSGIAGKFYENPQMWRPLAIANGISDPRFLAVGQPLRIPALPFIDPESGEVMR
ncbi:MAG: LysM peptidoglycan-binding domain-containing protein [candidate division KSB1 bacterium]|nr:LysM peptidoglycan-binding domain-containing protein [candidate division KSB1 bacterium]MDZ7286359.1 LysM peptidoglycan-binding domain-containing protein [candidate division KSB1 bacterium]MDZ7296587.1 LysM peptidoglycan-binding domain-containing protein [candidate division KSB1 bacterium]MDZ7306120.1 LysM peptidoglycan-binding domain-containing protein [candidate division KSB1 bacterium]MDZ7347453.1 LysM peptidoglycan-binding domain-containing protein [candidate division KSB1 bacterium]